MKGTYARTSPLDFDGVHDVCTKVLERLFVPAPLIVPSLFFNVGSDVPHKFEWAKRHYFQGDYVASSQAFEELFASSSISGQWLQRIVTWNIAACAAALGDDERVLSLLQSMSVTEDLYGIPLWNLALAHYRLSQHATAAQTMVRWVGRDNGTDKFRLGKGELITTCLFVTSGNIDDASAYLARAMEHNPRLVEDQFGMRMSRAVDNLYSSDSIHISGELGEITDSVRQELLNLVTPRQPKRLPALVTYLTSEEMEAYMHALELLAEGDYQRALNEFSSLHNDLPQITLLSLARAASLLFLTQDREAYELMRQPQQEGYQLPGYALWNLACAGIRLGLYREALGALEECAATEFRTSSALWTAIRFLRKSEIAGTDPAGHSREHDPKSPTDRIPTLEPHLDSVEARRIEILRQIISPKKLPKAPVNDLGRLSYKDRQNVELALEAAQRVNPAEAARLLEPMLEQHPALYLLKAHTAAWFLLSGELERAQSLLESARQLRRLDPVSLYNLASIYLEGNAYSRVAEVLSEGEDTRLAQEHTYWLALAMAFKLTGNPRAEAAAGRAVAVAGSRKSEQATLADLALAEIVPEKRVTEEISVVEAARRAIESLETGDIESALAILSKKAPDSVEGIPEIGTMALEPVLVERPASTWEINAVEHFEQGVREYRRGNFLVAVNAFDKVYEVLDPARPIGLAINMAAAYLKLREPSKAREIARTALGRQRTRRTAHMVHAWRLVYNLTLADAALGRTSHAVSGIKRDARLKPRKLKTLLIALCDQPAFKESFQNELVPALDELSAEVFNPSSELLLKLALEQLSASSPDLSPVKAVLRRLIPEGGVKLPLPTDVKTFRQVNVAYKALSDARADDIIGYMSEVIDTRSQDRREQDRPRTELENSIGAEFAARLLVTRVHVQTGEQEVAIRELYEAELLVKQEISRLPPGYLERDWLLLAQLAKEMGLYHTSARYVAEIAESEPNVKGAEKLREHIHELCKETDLNTLMESALEFQVHVEEDRFEQALVHAQALGSAAPLFSRVSAELLKAILLGDDDADLEDLHERTLLLARMELPREVFEMVESALVWLGRNQSRVALEPVVDIDVFDERIWPRLDDEREGSCLLTFTSRHELDCLSVREASGRAIWSGRLQARQTRYARWTFYREDGYASNLPIDIPLEVDVSVGAESDSFRTAINVIVEGSEPMWPTYPTGALSPDDIAGPELYGRSNLIRTVVRSLGSTRGSATFLLQGPRQMGKTSLLHFIRNQVPDHVLPIHINLEQEWSRDEPDNIWNYLVMRIMEEVGRDENQLLIRKTANDVVLAAQRACVDLGKNYVLFLVDEFHVLFDRSSWAEAVLANFRDFLNDSDKRITLMLSDRYTMDELEERCESDYWGQLTCLDVHPLDRASTKQAVEYPTRGTDVTFLPETTERLFELTGGYPYHVQRAAQYVLDILYSGPWATALPSDVDKACEKIVSEDRLFQTGLCRPDRIDSLMAEAIAALLEWRDLRELLPELARDNPALKDHLGNWSPQPNSFLTHLPGGSMHVMARLRNIGILKASEDALFSPLLEQWLLKMRRTGRGLISSSTPFSWQTTSAGDAALLSWRNWQNLDGELARRAKFSGDPPLKDKSSRTDDWESLAAEVTGETGFKTFVDAIANLFIEDRENKRAMMGYPWLFLVYHRMRLVRNYVVHRANTTEAARKAWNDVCTRALGVERNAYWPITAEEWRSLQVTLLRNLHAALINALEIAGESA